ncbi:MAG: hypothetical protein V3U45_07075 [bacterium]
MEYVEVAENPRGRKANGQFKKGHKKKPGTAVAAKPKRNPRTPAQNPRKKPRRRRRSPARFKPMDAILFGGGGGIGGFAAWQLPRMQQLPEWIRNQAPLFIGLMGLAMAYFMRDQRLKKVGAGVVAGAAFGWVLGFLAKRELANVVAATAVTTAAAPLTLPGGTSGLGRPEQLTAKRAAAMLGMATDRMLTTPLQVAAFGSLSRRAEPLLSPGVNPNLQGQQLADLGIASEEQLRAYGFGDLTLMETPAGSLGDLGDLEDLEVFGADEDLAGQFTVY